VQRGEVLSNKVPTTIRIYIFYFLYFYKFWSSSALCLLEALQPVWLIVRSPVAFLNVSALFARCLRGSPLVVKGGTMGEKWLPNGAWDIHPGFFYMPQICDMGPIIFTSLPKEGVLRTFIAL